MSIDEVSDASRAGADSSAAEDHAGPRGLTQVQCRAIRRRLQHDITRLRAEVAQETRRTDAKFRNPVGRDGSDVVDLGAQQASLDAEIGLVDGHVGLLAQSLHALSRLDVGTYGTCERCQQPIDPRRLRALARATTRVDCQAQTTQATPGHRTRGDTPGGRLA